MFVGKTNELMSDLKSLGSKEKAVSLQRFFKTEKGQYGYGDIFWGITVPLLRKTAIKYKSLEPAELEKLLENEIHEVRLSALLIMVSKSKEFPEAMYELYVKKTRFINNWDLVDLSAPIIIGQFLLDKDCALLYKFAKSTLLWERRIAIVATYAFIKQGQSEHTLKIAKLLMKDEHDLIHKAVGWMLREVGKRCSVSVLENFLEIHAATMPRTMLRYSLEHLEPERKKYFMRAKSKS
jgi:3-methyladenine DNA glycosylase AlkD